MSDESFDSYMQRRKTPISDIQYCQCCDCWIPIENIHTANVARLPSSRHSKPSRPSVKVPLRRSVRLAPAVRKYTSKQPVRPKVRRQRQRQYAGMKYETQNRTQKNSKKTRVSRTRRVSERIDNPNIVPYPKRAAESSNRNKISKRTSAKAKPISKSKKAKQTKTFKKRALTYRSEHPLKRNRSYKHVNDNTMQNTRSLLSCTQCGNLITTSNGSSVSALSEKSKSSSKSKVEMQSKTENNDNGTNDHVEENANANEKPEDKDIGKRTKSNLTQHIDLKETN